LSADSTGALVEVAFDAAPCVAAAPGLTMSPGTTVWTQPGVAARFTITLRNNDSAGCGASAFSLSSAVPAGWQAAFGSGSLTVEPGASASAALGVTPPAGASGQQSFTATASRGAAGTSATGTVGIATALTMTLSIGGSTKTGYPLAASVATGGQALANVTVTFTVSDAFGKNTVLSAVTNTSGVASVKWRPRKNDPAGTYQVRAAASSGGLSGSATGTLVR
jgi:hypothetical protein